ncbi:alpha/beta hydrolase [Mucilaginibacter conchicola]|uniref:Alpha/beta hydrolase n=1 Tax=Mucilaginibacter conchicola TaxID=2303333 RepID=A0A372NML4_9SPHI|nr:alpha/beta hydrolase [Mucilaginibacter conchicola]RFZ90098.1 alpha/beta hydrolase [Mucilaginibacter conchicola]
MTIGRIKISIICEDAELESILLDGLQIRDNSIHYEDKNTINFVQDIEQDHFELNLKISGNVGGIIVVIIERLAESLFSQTSINLLRNGQTERLFQFNLQSFTKEFLKDQRFRDEKNFGVEERSIVKTIKSPNYQTVVWFGTNRAVRNNAFVAHSVFESGADSLSLGQCRVNIPGRHKIGELNRPSWWKLEFVENHDKHFAILETKFLTQDDFLNGVLSKLSESSEQDAFIFIHGFNTSFNDGILRTAQLAFDLGFKGAPIFYSWPSHANLLNYPEDEGIVHASTEQFVSFLKLLGPIIKNKKVHIIAHSMGNRLVSFAINKLDKESFFEGQVFNQIVLAAPDLDAQQFLDEYANAITTVAKRITLYASSSDTALKISRNIHSSMIRLGESGGLITCFEGIDTIDASKTDPSFLGHGYYSDTAALINDIYQLFRFNFNPALRNLIPNNEAQELYWTFR